MKPFYIFFGILFTIIGIVGIFLPLLPTTPFLLIAAFFFDKGSKKFHGWLLNHPVLSPPIKDWQRAQIIRTKYKIISCTLMATSMIFVILKPTIPIYGKISMAIFLTAVGTFIITRRSR